MCTKQRAITATRKLSPVKSFLFMELKPPISTFLRKKTYKPVTLEQLQAERVFNVDKLNEAVAALQPCQRDTLKKAHDRAPSSSSRENLPRFSQGDFVLMARKYFIVIENMSLRSLSPRRVIKALFNISTRSNTFGLDSSKSLMGGG